MKTINECTTMIDEQIIENIVAKEVKSRPAYFFTKRLMDICISIFGIILASPIMLMIAFIVKLDSKGPIFFKHTRIGQKGKLISVYKFRTMVTNAEELLNKLTDEQKRDFAENFKLENDFRITKIGKFLRKSSLDELPQLLNILIGDMSLIGPRPIIKDELEKYKENVDKLLSVKPGLSGYWQVHGRSNTTYESRIKMELYYVENCSTSLDLRLMVKTIGAVIRKEGAK